MSVTDVTEAVIDAIDDRMALEFKSGFRIVNAKVGMTKSFEAAECDNDIKALAAEARDSDGNLWNIALSGIDKKYKVSISRSFDIALP